MLIGVIIGCATFAVGASQVNAIKFTFDGSEYRSTLDRGHDELAVLNEHGREIQGMKLQSYLFFGSANRLYRQVKTPAGGAARMSFPPPRLPTRHRRQLVRQTQLWPDLASSHKAGVHLVFVNLSPVLARAFRDHGIHVTVTSDFDRALEKCERAVIANICRTGTSRTLHDWLAEDLGSESSPTS